MARPDLAPNYQQLGKSIETVLGKQYVRLLGSKRTLMWHSLLHGFFVGLGGVIGATLGVAILLYVLEQAGGSLPLIGNFLEGLGETIKQ